MENVKEKRLPTIYVADNVDGNDIVRYFKESEDFNFVGASFDGQKVVEEVSQLLPDVLVMEVMLENLVLILIFQDIDIFQIYQELRAILLYANHLKLTLKKNLKVVKFKQIV